MQRHSKILQTKVNAKAVVTALICVVFLLVGSVVSAYAITPPAPSTTSVQGRPSSEQLQKIVNIANYQSSMGSFNSVVPVLIVYDGSSTLRALGGLVSDNLVPVLNGDNWEYGLATTRSYQYSMTSGGFGLVSTTYTFSISDDRVLAYKTSISGDFILNPNFSVGSANVSIYDAVYDSWKSFYDKVFNYDTNLQNATNAGFAQGQLVGRVEGREEGYETGYDEGYDDGYDGGYDAGANVGYQNGLTHGREEGYETGYDEGEQYGYEVGYREGQDYTYPIAYQEGYDDGYEQGASIGGAPSVSYELDVGSIISALPQAARNIIDGALGFEIFGINVAGTLTAILVVAIVGFVVKWLLSLKS